MPRTNPGIPREKGTRLDPTGSLSQILHPTGKDMLKTASLAPASHPPTPLLRARADGREEISLAVQGEICSSQIYNGGDNVR
jgi:hypothetical protein